MNETASRSPLPDKPIRFERQRRLLALLDAFGGSLPKVDLQQLLFLWCQEANRGDSFEFVPYLHGAFSFTAGAHLRGLVERGLVTDDGTGWILTPAGKQAVGGVPDRELVSFARRHRDLRGDALVARTYRMFPYYATRSEIAGRVLGGDPEALQRIEDERPVTTPAALFTIGYEGRSLEGYLNALLRAGVTILCDVRRNPLSRKYGFAKSTLSTACVGVGLRYEHLPELGIAAERRRSLECQADYDALFAAYEHESLPVQGEALGRIRDWVRSGARVALTCYERLPQLCHRHCVAEALERDLGMGFGSVHL